MRLVPTTKNIIPRQVNNSLNSKPHRCEKKLKGSIILSTSCPCCCTVLLSTGWKGDNHNCFRFCKMPVLEAAKWLFRGIPAVRTTPPNNPDAEECPITPPRASDKKNRDDKGPKRSKRKWRPPTGVAQLRETLREAGKKNCCKRIGCLNLFAAGADPRLYSLDLLTLEQKRITSFGTEKDRKQFVGERVPLRKLDCGTMYAANSPVCTYAFTNLFGVSENLITACKGNPGARASSSISR